jgi:hypothetical protein
MKRFKEARAELMKGGCKQTPTKIFFNLPNGGKYFLIYRNGGKYFSP